MTMFARLAGAVALGSALISAPAFAQDAPIAGAWETTMETPMGNFAATLTVSPAGEGYAVEMAEQMPEGMPAMESTISNVVVDGSTVTFDRALTTPQGQMALKYSFTATGDAITGAANSDFGAMAITGTRKAE